MIILGIDPGTQSTGFGLLKKEGSQLQVIDFGVITTSPKLELRIRYHLLFESLEELLQKYHPDIISVETQFFHRNAQNTIKISMARAMVLLASSRAKIPLYEYPPKKAKLAVVGSGSAPKERVQKMLQLQLGIQQKIPEDAADALALAICYIHAEKCTNIYTER